MGLLLVPQEYPGAPAPTDEESITFKSFLDSLDKGLVAKVDFLAGGNKAYAFVKPSATGEPARIRVGEGYPDEQGDGWSSPLWVVRALNDRNVSEKGERRNGTKGRGGGGAREGSEGAGFFFVEPSLRALFCLGCFGSVEI